MSNGSALGAPEPPRDKPRKVNFVTDIKHFGLFHRRSKQSAAAEPSAHPVFSVSEQVARHQAEAPQDRRAALEPRGLAARGEPSIPGLSDQCVLVDHRDRNADGPGLQVGRRMCPFKSEKGLGEDTVPIIPKDDDAAPATDAVTQEEYVTTRL